MACFIPHFQVHTKQVMSIKTLLIAAQVQIFESGADLEPTFMAKCLASGPRDQKSMNLHIMESTGQSLFFMFCPLGQ